MGRNPVIVLPQNDEYEIPHPPIVEDAHVRYSHGNPVIGSSVDGTSLTVPEVDLCPTDLMECFSYPFEIAVNATMDARVTWTETTSVFDMQLFAENGTSLARRGANYKWIPAVTDGANPELANRMVLKLAPGAYSLRVEAFTVIKPDTFHLVVNFDRPGLSLLERPFFLTNPLGLTEEAPGPGVPLETPVPRAALEMRPFSSKGVVFEGPELTEAFNAQRVHARVFFKLEQGAGIPTGETAFSLDFGTADIATAHIGSSTIVRAPVGPDHVRNATLGESEVLAVEFSLKTPIGGLVLPSGAKPAFRITTSYSRAEDEGRILILTDSAHTPSQILLEGRPIPLAPVVAEESFTDHVVAGPHSTNPGSNQCYSYTVTLSSSDLGFRAKVRYAGAEPGPDIDIQLRDTGGNDVAGGWSLRTEDGLEIYKPNLDVVGPGDFELRVLCQYLASVYEFDLDTWVFRPG